MEMPSNEKKIKKNLYFHLIKLHNNYRCGRRRRAETEIGSEINFSLFN